MDFKSVRLLGTTDDALPSDKLVLKLRSTVRKKEVTSLTLKLLRLLPVMFACRPDLCIKRWI
jgi:hypothetical protein